MLFLLDLSLLLTLGCEFVVYLFLGLASYSLHGVLLREAGMLCLGTCLKTIDWLRGVRTGACDIHPTWPIFS